MGNPPEFDARRKANQDGLEPDRERLDDREIDPRSVEDQVYNAARIDERQGTVDAERLRVEFAGKEPPGTQRSDEAIHDDVVQALAEALDVDARGIEVRVVAGEVTLLGAVSELGEHIAADRAAARVEGVRAVKSELQVTSA